MIKYPNGQKTISIEKNNLNANTNRRNMGMSLEKEVALSAQYYIEHNLAFFYKKPTPIRVFKMSKTNTHMITEAYYDAKSTTDYNGMYKTKYIDFECKETKTHIFSLDRLGDHQYSHLKMVDSMGGLAFVLLRFMTKDETYLIDIKYITYLKDKGLKNSLNYDDAKENGYLIESSYVSRLKILDAMDSAYFKDEEREKIS